MNMHLCNRANAAVKTSGRSKFQFKSIQISKSVEQINITLQIIYTSPSVVIVSNLSNKNVFRHPVQLLM